MEGSFLSEFYDAGRLTAAYIGLCGIMAFGGIDVFMPKNVRNNVNVPGFLIEHGAIGTAELMRRNLF